MITLCSRVGVENESTSVSSAVRLCCIAVRTGNETMKQRQRREMQGEDT